MRILIYRLGSLGDSVVALPCFHLVRRQFPDAQITLLTNHPIASVAPPLQAILENTGTFDDVIAYPVNLDGWRAIAELRAEIARRKFDLAISLADARGWKSSVRDWLFFKSCGIPRVVGVPFRRRELACQPVVGSDLFEWETDRLLSRIAPLGRTSTTDESLWDLRLTATERAEARALLRDRGIRAPFLALAAGTKVSAKDWGEDRWRSVLQQLAPGHSDVPLVLLGGREDRPRNERLASHWRGLRANLAGLCGPRVSAAVLESARVFAGLDSGPMHLAACVGVPCVIVFSARSLPGQWHPRPGDHTILYRRTPCFGCALDQCSVHRLQCLTSIPADEVVAALERQLGRAPANAAQHREPALA